MAKTQFKTGTIVTPTFMNAMANAVCKKSPSNDGEVKSPSFDELSDANWLTKDILLDFFQQLGLNSAAHMSAFTGEFIAAAFMTLGSSPEDRLALLQTLRYFIDSHPNPVDVLETLSNRISNLSLTVDAVHLDSNTKIVDIHKLLDPLPGKVSSWMDATDSISVGLAGGNILNGGNGVTLGTGEEASLQVTIPVGAGCRAYIDFSMTCAFGSHGSLSGEFEIYFPFTLDDTPFPTGNWHAGVATLYDRVNSLIRRFDVFLSSPAGAGQTLRFLEQKGGVGEEYLKWGSWATACQFWFSGTLPVRPGYIASKTTLRS